MTTDTLELLKEGAKIRKWQEESKKRLAEINQILAERATYREGSATGHIYGGNIHATITKKKSVKFDQDLLFLAMKEIGEIPFEGVFKRKYEPRSKAALRGFFQTANDKEKKLVWDAMTEEDVPPYVKYETIEEV